MLEAGALGRSEGPLCPLASGTFTEANRRISLVGLAGNSALDWMNCSWAAPRSVVAGQPLERFFTWFRMTRGKENDHPDLLPDRMLFQEAGQQREEFRRLLHVAEVR